MTDKLPPHFDHERAGTELQKKEECDRCHENPCECNDWEEL